MKRKIVQHGSSSLTITLPRSWVQRFGLSKGDDLDIEESGSRLIITTGKETALKKKQFVVSESGMFTKYNLSHLYQLGYDEIEIRYDSQDTLQQIRERLPNCIGFEIIDQKENKVVIRSIATTIETEFDTLLRKSFLITNEMAKAVLEALVEGSFKKLPDIRNMEDLNNRFTDVCIRILNKRGYADQNKTLQAFESVKNIERICDELKFICDIRFEKIPGQDVISLYRRAIDYYLNFYEMFYSFSPERKKTVYEQKTVLLREINACFSEKDNAESLLLHSIQNIVQKTFEGAGAYFALVL